MKLRFTKDAARDAVEARDWYEQRLHGLGDRFQQAFDAAALAIAETPALYRDVFTDRRRVFLRGFPYFLIYAVIADTAVVGGCFHAARRSSVWRRRDLERPPPQS